MQPWDGIWSLSSRDRDQELSGSLESGACPTVSCCSRPGRTGRNANQSESSSQEQCDVLLLSERCSESTAGEAVEGTRTVRMWLSLAENPTHECGCHSLQVASPQIHR